MARTSLRARLQRLFSTNVIVRHAGGKTLKIADTNKRKSDDKIIVMPLRGLDVKIWGDSYQKYPPNFYWSELKNVLDIYLDVFETD